MVMLDAFAYNYLGPKKLSHEWRLVTFYYYLLLSIAELVPSSPLAKASYMGAKTVFDPAI
jgi:hypothetical protein